MPRVCADDERKFIKYVLAFFASSDGIVIENLAARFMSGEQRCEHAGTSSVLR